MVRTILQSKLHSCVVVVHYAICASDDRAILRDSKRIELSIAIEDGFSIHDIEAETARRGGKVQVLTEYTESQCDARVVIDKTRW